MDRRINQILAVVIIITGVLGMVLGAAGVTGTWVLRPGVYQGLDSTLTTVETAIETGLNVLEVTDQALSATVNSLEAVETMIDATADIVAKTKPILDKVNDVVGNALPATLGAAKSSLEIAQNGARVIGNAIESLEKFRENLSEVPLIGDLIGSEKDGEAVNNDKPLHESLGEVVSSLEVIPGSLEEMSGNLEQADDQLGGMEASLTNMADNVREIITSLEEYQEMIDQAGESLQQTLDLLLRVHENLNTILILVAVFLTLFFLWLIAVQVVILLKGWEMWRSTRIISQSDSELDA